MVRIGSGSTREMLEHKLYRVRHETDAVHGAMN